MADQIRPTPRSPILGLFSDLVNVPLQYMSSPQRTQQMRGVAELIRSTGVPYVLENLSYDPSGRGLFTGAGGLGGTTRLRPEAVEAAMTVAPMVGPAARVAGRGAMAVGRAGERYAERVVPQIMERGGLPAQMVSAMGQGTQSPMIVWHGSPHRFTKFDSSKIGTGEGAQAYGHGLYLAESPEVAKGYQAATSKDRFITKDGFFDPSQLEHLNVKATVRKGDLDAAIETARKYARPDHDYPETAAKAARDLARLEALKASGGMTPNPGALYKVDLPDEHVAKMLDWDRPFSQQAPEVRMALQDAGVVGKDDWLISGMRGREIYNRASIGAPAKLPLNQADDQIFSAQRLRQAGIPGIRYLDGGSRGRGAGTSNFVVFPGEEDLLRILDINPPLRNPIMYEDPFRSSVR